MGNVYTTAAIDITGCSRATRLAPRIAAALAVARRG
jgi:hypothetical protein